MVDADMSIKFKGGGEGVYRPDRLRKDISPTKDSQRVVGKEKEKGEEDNPEETKIREKFSDAKKKTSLPTVTRKPLEHDEGDEVSLFDLSRKSAAEKGAKVEVPEPKKGEPKVETSSKTLVAAPFDVQQRQLETLAAEVATPVTGPSRIHDLVNKLIDKLTILQASDRNETTLTIKNNTMFEGTRVVISEFNTAKGEFNIAFENLTQQAKDLLDSNQNAFRMGLEQKGYVVHIITTSTLNERGEIVADSSDRTRDEEEREEQPEQDEPQE